MDFEKKFKKALETGEMTCKALFLCLTILECLNMYSKWFVQFSTSWSIVKEILCVFLGCVHVHVYDIVFMCLFRPVESSGLLKALFL